MTPALELDRVTVRLDRRTIVAEATLAVAPGSLVALVGPNGAGKTTLLRAVAGVLAHAGVARLAGRDAATLPPRQRARMVAYLPQQRDVAWRLAVRDVVALGRLPHRSLAAGLSAEDLRAVAAAMRAADVVHLADRPATRLSGGERARALIARTLAQEAPLLLVDEPTASLDPYHQLQVMELLRARAAAGAAVVAVLHDLTLAGRFAHAVCLMHGGRVVATGAPDAVLTEAALAAVYGVTRLAGRHEGEGWLLPWRRR